MRLLRHSALITASAAFGCLVLGTLAGCGNQPVSSGLQTVPVRGLVTRAGQPVPDAVVTFQPVQGSHVAIGRTDAAGRYSLSTVQPDDGALPGEYHVQIVKYEEQETPVEEGATPPLKNLLPAKYATPQTSGLAATVGGTGANTFDFNLE